MIEEEPDQQPKSSHQELVEEANVRFTVLRRDHWSNVLQLVAFVKFCEDNELFDEERIWNRMTFAQDRIHFLRNEQIYGSVVRIEADVSKFNQVNRAGVQLQTIARNIPRPGIPPERRIRKWEALSKVLFISSFLVFLIPGGYATIQAGTLVGWAAFIAGIFFYLHGYLKLLHNQ